MLDRWSSRSCRRQRRRLKKQLILISTRVPRILVLLLNLRRNLADLLHLRIAQLNIRRPQVLLGILQLLRTRNG